MRTRQVRTFENDMRHFPLVVAFCGFKGSGKTTAAQALLAKGYLRHPLAAPIKLAMEAFGVPRAALENAGAKEQPLGLLCGRTPRYAMQTLGTEWGRGCIGEDFWLRVWEATAPWGLIVVDDVRFVNEAQFLRARGACVYRVERAGCGGDDHRSEVEHHEIEVDGVVVNDGDVRSLGDRVRGLLTT